MRNIALISKNILKQAFRKKSNIITFILLPILGVFISLYLTAVGNSYTKVGVVDLNKSYISVDMIKAMKANSNFIIDENIKEENVNKLLLNRNVDCVVVIPKDFDKSLINAKDPQIEIASVRGKEITAWIENYVNYYVDNLVSIGKVAEGNSSLFKELYEGYKNQSLKLENISISDKGKDKSATKQSIGLLLVFMLMASSVTSGFIMRDKFNKTYYRIFCSSVTKGEYIFANVFSNLLIYTMQVCIILVISLYILNLNFYINTATLFIILLSFGLVSIGFGIIIAAFSKTFNQSSYLSNILITPTCMLSGCFWSIEMMPKWMQQVAMIFPQSWVLKTIDELQHGKSFADVYSYIIIVILFALAFFIIGIIKLQRDENLKSIV